MRRRGGKSFGTPTGEPQPQAIDDFTGFKVPLKSLRKNWDGLLTQRPDIRNSQDFVRGIKDDMSLPYSRPEPPDTFLALPITWENGAYMTTEQGDNIFQEGAMVSL
jgi:hypothetical protein